MSHVATSDLGIEPRGPRTISALAAAFEQFIDHIRWVDGQSIETIASYKTAFANLRHFLEQDRTNGILGAGIFDVDAWLRWNRSRVNAPSVITIHTYWRRLRSLCSAIERTTGAKSPFAGHKAPALPVRVPKARTMAECARIIAAAQQYPGLSPFERTRNVAMLAVILFAGLRRREVLRLLYLDVSLEDATIHIEKGKGRGGGKDRMAFIAPDLRRHLGAYLDERRRAGITAPEFFASTLGNRGVSLSTFRRVVARVREASGIAFSLHALRHSFITQLLRSGVPIHTVSDLAGHTQITTTAGYLRVWDEDRRKAVHGLSYGNAA
ncbi:MAG: integrase/recombinase XerD [Gemmatimonadaceae bacterium]|jgi:site-specific recombinase XerD|nr:integrase/recombinase XerD [Gemmatimonadaceae bacterium]